MSHNQTFGASLVQFQNTSLVYYQCTTGIRLINVGLGQEKKSTIWQIWNVKTKQEKAQQTSDNTRQCQNKTVNSQSQLNKGGGVFFWKVVFRVMAVHADEEEGTDSSAAAAGAANTFDPWMSGAAAQPLPASSLRRPSPRARSYRTRVPGGSGGKVSARSPVTLHLKQPTYLMLKLERGKLSLSKKMACAWKQRAFFLFLSLAVMMLLEGRVLLSGRRRERQRSKKASERPTLSHCSIVLRY